MSQFNELTELPALGPAHRLFSATAPDLRKVYIQQQPLSSLSNNDNGHPEHTTSSWLAQASAVFDQGGYHYRVIPVQHYTHGFADMTTAVRQQQVCVLTVLHSLMQLLQRVHQAGYILGELKAEALYWSATGDQVCLLDCRFASNVSRVHPLQVKNELDIAMLRTLAPEATGRVNCPLDQRADLYALGILSYALLSGRFPFEEQQPLALVHAHIAKKPTALTELDATTDTRVARIIETLLNKDPNDRYQSIKGALRDLEYCINNTAATDNTPFLPSVYLGVNQLPFADKLYERAATLQLLERTLEQSHLGRELQVVAVQGYSGSGKTSVIKQLHPLTLNGHTFFVQGKHDQYLQNALFTGLKSALEQLAEAVLQEPEAELKQWQQRLQLAAGEDAHLLTSLVLEWHPILCPAASCSVIAATGNQSRFNQLLLRIFQVFAEHNRTLVLFLDDMQWADRATLRWLELLATQGNSGRIMLVLSFRNNEIHASHPLQYTLDAIGQSAATLQHISINPLSDKAIMQLLTDTLQHKADALQPLADILIQKTSGNPFYLKQFLLKLHHDKLLYSDADGIWHWQLNNIARQSMSEHHAEVVAQRLQQFSAQVQQLLKLIALLGDEATIDILAGICQCSAVELEQQLSGPVNSGLLIAFTTPDGQHLSYVHFSHDKLQQAAFQLTSSQSEQQLHASIASYYLEQLPTAALQQQHIFSFITHLNAAGPLNPVEPGPEKRLEFNLMAAHKALTTNAYDTAHSYFEQARLLLTHQPQAADTEPYRTVYAGLAQSSYLTQDTTQAWYWCQQLDKLPLNLLQRMENCQQKILILFAQNQLDAAFTAAADVLAEIGIDISVSEQIISQYPQILTMYSTDNIAALVDKPALEDVQLLQAMEILGTLFTVAYIVSPLHYMTVTYHLVKLSLQRGNSASSALGYLGHGMNLVAAFGQYQAALQFADLALSVNQHYQGKFQGQLHFQRAAAILPWNGPLQHAIQALDDSFIQALRDGNLEYAAHSVLFGSFYRVLSGQPLAQVAKHGERAIQFLTEKQFPYNLEFTQIWQQLTLNLCRPTDSALLLEGEAFAESRQLPLLQQTNNHTLLFCYHSIKLMLASLLDNDELALQHIQAAEPLSNVALALYHQTEYFFYAGLTYSRLLQRQTKKTSSKAQHWQQQLSRILQMFEAWATSGHANHLHKVELLRAEQAALAQQTDAWQYYQRAISHAEQQGFSHHVAIAHERAADYWQQMDHAAFAAEHRRSAMHYYQQWQANTKVEQLQAKYPELQLLVQPSATVTADRQLDLVSIFKASETLSGKVDLTAFLNTMLHIMVENAGAQHGCLLFSIEQEDLVLQATTSAALAAPPAALLNLVRRSGKARLYNDTRQEPMLSSAYAAGSMPASMLSIPIAINGVFRGVLHLQHNDMTGAFTQERVQVLQLLANQTAILFENTRLSQQLAEANKNLEQKITARTRELAQAKLKAEAATEAKSAFLARMSHEIRTPINAVIGLSQLASKRAADHEQVDLLSKIKGSGEMLLSLVNDILDFSKVEAGQLTLEQTSFAINQVVQQAINMTALKAHSKGLELVADVSADIPQQLVGDPLRIQQLLINLVNNAVKFTEKGSVCIMLHGNKTTGRQYQLHGSVTDTGIGMSEQQQKRLFRSFQQADDSITRKYGGSGLGLIICKQLCELMSGEIWLESEAGYGSTFYFTLGLQLPEYYHPTDKQVLTAKPRVKALVVDDMALTRMVLLKQLDELGIQAEQTDNGQDAINKVAQAEQDQQPYDFILMDWRMPQMDGIETARQIQQQLGSRSPNILMVSAYDTAVARAALNQVHIEHFLEKPVSYTMLLDAIGPLLFDVRPTSPRIAQVATQDVVPDLSTKRILLVEDHAINRQVALGFLHETSADVDIAENGAAALSKLQQQHYDLVLMDIQMPEMDGLTASRLIRQQLLLTELPIIAMTAHAMAEDIEKSRLAGMNAHLTKPIIAEQLYATLQQQLQIPVKLFPHKTLPVLTAEVSQDPLQLDEARARANLGAQAALYPSLRHIFLNEHKALADKLQNQLHSHDFDAISRAMHSLKAAAAYVGAFAFAEHCGQVETHLRCGRPDKAEIELAIHSLRKLIEQLSQQTDSDKPAMLLPFNQQQLNLELQRLLPMLQQSDFDAETQLEHLTELTANSDYAADIAALYESVNQIEFETATGQLLELLTKLAAQHAGQE
ncbi:ATP-binding hybrid sensor histidine kinase/response regulator [Arsukibacterium ikkense]|uniref:ATP-binding hybrid sensor histidine kinase/response regulator n=1 Tax=Arsukibacterium ikkense TaxID=336831 RepID=UPI0013792251|nr:ATP-binding hybrid sensor histidine kinase/response regulator [Arsukibacterium ikkense]